MPQSTCSVESCEREHAARGWCLMHYKRAMRRGGSLKPQSCENCGADMSERRSNARVCSRGCGFQLTYSESRDRLLEYQRQNYQANRHMILARQKEYYLAHSDERRQYSARYYQENRTRIIEAAKTWQQANPRKTSLARSRTRAARRASIGTDRISERDWERLLRRYRGRCAYCSVETAAPHMDHVVPLCHGGRHTIGNVLPACPSCNLSKNSRFLADWRFRYLPAAGRPLPRLVGV